MAARRTTKRNTALDEAIKRAGITQTAGGYKLPTNEVTYSTPTPQIQPFFTPENSMASIDRESGVKNALWEIDKQLADLRATTGFEMQTNERAKVKNVTASADSMAARGLSQSSIKDAELFDIEATARMRKDFLQSALSRAETDAGTAKTRINDEWGRWQEAMSRQAVGNASDAMQGVPATTQRTATETQPYRIVKAPGKDGGMLTWHIYPDGRRVAIKKKG